MNVYKKIKDNKVMSAGLGYTVGNILIKGINFIALPLFSRIMTTEEIGVYTVFTAYESILFVILGMAMHSSIRSANYEFKNEIDQYTSSITLIYVGNTIIFCIFSFLFREGVSKLLDMNMDSIFLLILYSFGTAVFTLYNYRLSLDYSYKRYLIISFLNSICNVVISLVLILTIFRNKKDIGRIWGTTGTVVVITFFLLLDLYKKARPHYNKKYWSFAVKYSLPIIPHGISQILLSQFDRVMIKSLVNASAAGIYGLVANIKIILTVISESISTAWTTWFYEKMAKGEIDSIQKRATQLVMIFSVFTIGMMALSPELILFLGGTQYEVGKYVAIPMIMDAFVLFLYNLIVSSEYYMKKTKYIMVGTLITAVMNIILNYVFINKYGFIAAAYTTLFSYICYLILHIILSYRLVYFHVLPIKMYYIYGGIIVIFAGIDISFIQSIFIRYLSCGAGVFCIGCILLKNLR